MRSRRILSGWSGAGVPVSRLSFLTQRSKSRRPRGTYSSDASRCRRSFPFSDRKREGKCSALIWIRRRPDSAAVTLHDRSRHQQAQAHTLSLGSNEWLEQPVRHTRVDASAAIAHAHSNPSGLFWRHLDGHAASISAGICDRVEGVHDQIQHALLQLDRVADDSLPGGRDLDLHCDLPHRRLAGGQLHHLVDQWHRCR